MKLETLPEILPLKPMNEKIKPARLDTLLNTINTAINEKTMIGTQTLPLWADNTARALGSLGDLGAVEAIDPIFNLMQDKERYKLDGGKALSKILSQRERVQQHLGVEKAGEIYSGLDKGLAAVPADKTHLAYQKLNSLVRAERSRRHYTVSYSHSPEVTRTEYQCAYGTCTPLSVNSWGQPETFEAVEVVTWGDCDKGYYSENRTVVVDKDQVTAREVIVSPGRDELVIYYANLIS